MAALSDAITLRPSHPRRSGQNTDEERLQRRKTVENETKTGSIKKKRATGKCAAFERVVRWGMGAASKQQGMKCEGMQEEKKGGQLGIQTDCKRI